MSSGFQLTGVVYFQTLYTHMEEGYSRGCRLSLQFPTVKLLDYEARWLELEASDSPFAVLVMAHLRTQATTQDLTGRLRWKLSLIKRMYELGYSRDKILQLLKKAITIESTAEFQQQLSRLEYRFINSKSQII